MKLHAAGRRDAGAGLEPAARGATERKRHGHGDKECPLHGDGQVVGPRHSQRLGRHGASGNEHHKPAVRGHAEKEQRVVELQGVGKADGQHGPDGQRRVRARRQTKRRRRDDAQGGGTPQRGAKVPLKPGGRKCLEPHERQHTHKEERVTVGHRIREGPVDGHKGSPVAGHVEPNVAQG